MNSQAIEQIHGEPSPLEFMRYVARNTPFVARKAASNWVATRKWNLEYLGGALAGETVNVAVTPYGFVTTFLWHLCGGRYEIPSDHVF